jgi:glutathione S-transferase
MLKAGESDETRVEQLKEQLSDKLDVYDKILSQQPYLAGQVIERFM